MLNYDIIIVGGGASGMLAAMAAKKSGAQNILIIEREDQLGGSLNQLIHTGFGIYTFGENFTGPEYAQRLIDEVRRLNIEVKLKSLVIEVSKEKTVTVVNEEGINEFKCKAIVLAMGCREKPRGAVNIPGSKCAGIFTVGTTQKFINMEGYMPGKQVVMVGSSDIGLLMARNMVLEGANVKAVLEPMSYASGSERNIEECIKDFNIPLKLGYTIVDILGHDRVEGVVISRVDNNLIPIVDTEERISCDTLLLSAGLLPESELALKTGILTSNVTGGIIVDRNQKTNIEGIFACGDVLYVHDLEEDISIESISAGNNAARVILKKFK